MTDSNSSSSYGVTKLPNQNRGNERGKFEIKEFSPVAEFEDAEVSKGSQNPPKARLGASMNWFSEGDEDYELFSNEIFVFGGADEQHDLYSDLYKFDFAEKKWEEIKDCQGRFPDQRNFHSAVIHRGSLWIFGGKSLSYRSDLHQFHFETKTWTEYRPEDYVENQNTSNAVKLRKGHAVEESESIIDKYYGKSPSKRYGHSAVIYDDSMYICGGYDHFGFECGDIWRFRFDNLTWEQVQIQHQTTAGVNVSFHMHSAVVYQGSMFLFGGKSQSQFKNKLYEFRFSTGILSEVNCKGKVPTPRWGHKAIVWGGNMYLFGGSDAAISYGDLYTYQFNTRTWTRQVAEGLNSRFFHSAGLWKNNFIVFGGLNSHDFLFNDLKIHCLNKFESEDTFVADFGGMLNKPDSFSDITFVFDKEGVNAKITAHKNILCARSERFRVMFGHDMQESRRGIVNIDGTSFRVFYGFLIYLYTNRIPSLSFQVDEEAPVDYSIKPHKLSSNEIFELLKLGDEYLLEHLKMLCQRTIQRCVAVDNVCGIYRTAQQLTARELEEFCFRFMLDHYADLVTNVVNKQEEDRTLISELSKWLKL